MMFGEVVKKALDEVRKRNLAIKEKAEKIVSEHREVVSDQAKEYLAQVEKELVSCIYKNPDGKFWQFGVEFCHGDVANYVKFKVDDSVEIDYWAFQLAIKHLGYQAANMAIVEMRSDPNVEVSVGDGRDAEKELERFNAREYDLNVAREYTAVSVIVRKED